MTVFSRDLFPLVRELEPLELQSVVNYASSRTRACGNTLATRLSAMPNGDHTLFILAIGREVSAANALLGLATTLFDDFQIAPPYCLRSLTPLVVQNRLTDWSSLSLAVTKGRETGDDLLAVYENCWWYPFDERADIERFLQSPLDIVRAWRSQRRHLPAPIHVVSRGLINLQSLSDEELDKAWDIGCDSLRMIDRDLEANEKTLADVTLLLVKSEANLRDLQAVLSEAEEETQRALEKPSV